MIQLGLCEHPVNDLFMAEGPKRHPQITPTPRFSEPVSHGADTRNTNYSAFSGLPPPPPYPSDHPAALSHEHPSPSPAGRRIWGLFSQLLAWPPCESILSLLQTSAPQHSVCRASGKWTWFGPSRESNRQNHSAAHPYGAFFCLISKDFQF